MKIENSSNMKNIVLVFMFAVTCFGFLVSSAVADADIDKGKSVYNGVGACAACHGASGKGDGPAGGVLTPKPRDFTVGDYVYDTNGDGTKGSEADLFDVITNGSAKYGGSPLMAGRADIPEADRKALIKYIVSLKQ